ncbi:hypothetical protein CHU92_10660 [Flavobacterium cyanobacteriorum]|uniref:Chromosome partitioning protein ParA n=1 Tax=Flavobacterium cyanobacteriorum TaxID=2022802 RepID=A0A255Z2H1_9FLAO|nr:hypothetical protein [Flavobacterium cyanobacteriorum]OYQ35666.1 hypothetical protein CHU92_10660 [Flavobacterium cyanobacteriorum]
MEQKSNSSLKAIIIVLAILLVGSLTYMYKMSTENEEVEKSNEALMSDKEILLNDLNTAKASYDKAIAENSGLKSELEAERAKIEQLIAEVKKSKGDVASLRRFKDDYRRLKRDMDNLMAENKKLKGENASLTAERDSTRNALDQSRMYNDTLVSQNENLSRTVEKASKLTIVNLKTESFKERSSGKLIATDKASRVDKLKISFTIAANEVAKSGSRLYYVQIIDSKNNVLGDKKTETFGDYTLTYSFTTNVAYQNKTMEISEVLPGKDFAKGTYFVNIFDKDQLVANSSFSLR